MFLLIFHFYSSVGSERLFYTQMVGSSNLSRSTNLLSSSNWLGHFPFTEEITDSSSVDSTTCEVLAKVASQFHKLKVGGSNPPFTTK